MAAALVRDPAESLKSGDAIAETRERNCDLTGVCLDPMVSVTRFSVAQRLDSLGLRKTLIVVKKADHYAVSRINRIDRTLDLTPIGSFTADHLPRIGRVGIPDPQLAIPWTTSMAFYGKWFDYIGGTGAANHLLRQITSLPREKILAQVTRDDQYAIIGSYYSVFRAIMDAKRRVPLILIDDTFLSLASFPVVLPILQDSYFEQTLFDVLRSLLRLYRSTPPRQEPGPRRVEGIEVDET